MSAITNNTKEGKRKNTQPGRLLKIASEKRGLLILSCLLSILGAGASFVPFISIYAIIRELLIWLSSGGGIAPERFLLPALLALAGTSAGLLLSFCSTLLSHKAAFEIIHRLRLRFAHHIARLPMGYHTANATAKTRKIMKDSINQLETFIAHQLPDMAGSVASPLIMLTLLFVFDWRLGLACLAGLLISFIVEARGMMTPAARRFMAEFQKKQEDMANASVEYIRGMAVVKAFGQSVFSFRKFYDLIKENEKLSLDYSLSVKKSYSLFQVLLNSLFLFVLPVGILVGSRSADYQAFALSFLFYLVFSAALSGPVMKLLYVFSSFHLIRASAEKIDSVFALPEMENSGAVKIMPSLDIAFQDVGFSYEEGQDQQTLRNVSFTAQAGRLTALVGPSGSGKTTIAQLIPRFWDVQEGKITIGGVNIRDYDMDFLMSQISFVFQDVFLYKMSILENIRIGREKASDKEVIAAAKAAMCHEFIEQLPEGYHTVYGKAGIHLSGGEMQRIVIARALIKDSPIVLLDEATAFADPENEQKIQQALEVLMKEKTVIVIAHRLSTIRGADKIVVVDDGRIAEQGTHERLMGTGIKYQAMWNAYSRALGWKLKTEEEAAC
ncbi:Vitamin B12 import ATP-binding protein BtuD [bioreactor metagenome]|uniref:Vitamin B12 import ATP-binding protein BtuD n=1 Tax=bioreactor metagenome TaxID=1076179 RepID=A0A644XTZ4_9ZZZZ